MSRNDCRIYVGNLPPDIRAKDIEDLFYKFGKIAFVDLKTRRGPPFAFVEFVDPRDAKDAVHQRDGYDYDGYKLRVEFPRGRERGPGGVFKSHSRPSRSGPPSRRSHYRIKVTGLPPSGSWQDLKDHMREAGDVCYADVFKDGTGVVEFIRHEDMKYAVKKLDDTRFRSHEGEVTYVRIFEDNSKYKRMPSRSRSRSRSRSKSQSRSISPKRSRASPTYSPARDESRSKSRSRSSSKSRSRSPIKASTKDRHNNNYRNGRSGGGGGGDGSRSYSRSPDDSYTSSRSRSPSPEIDRRGKGGRRAHDVSGKKRSRSSSRSAHSDSMRSDSRSRSRSMSKD